MKQKRKLPKVKWQLKKYGVIGSFAFFGYNEMPMELTR